MSAIIQVALWKFSPNDSPKGNWQYEWRPDNFLNACTVHFPAICLIVYFQVQYFLSL